MATKQIIETRIVQTSSQVQSLRYTRQVSEVDRFDDGTGRCRYRVKGKSGRHYLLPEELAQILHAIDDVRSVSDVSIYLRAEGQLILSPEQVNAAVLSHLLPKGLVSAPGDDLPSEPVSRKSWLNFDFVFRLPIVSAEKLRPIVTPLKLLYHPSVAVFLLFVIGVVHYSFYRGPGIVSAKMLTSSQLPLAYILAFISVCIHELGHATACRLFDCEHGDIGFCLYLTIPAFYIDLSSCWRLTRLQRIVIDLGGIYFQLLATIPLFIAGHITHDASYNAALMAIDMMVLFATNPLLKFDGYWVLVDASGFANLQPRALTLIKECLMYPFTLRSPSILTASLNRWRILIITFYSLAIGAGIAVSVPFLVMSVPAQLHQLLNTTVVLPHLLLYSPKEFMVKMTQVIGSILFFTFLYRFGRKLLSSAGRQIGSAWRKYIVDGI